MIGKLFINDKDAWTTWGVFLEDGSEAKLLLPPPNKAYVENKFRSEPGKQVIAINPQPDEKDLQLVFCISTTDKKDYLKKYRQFVNELNNGIIQLKVPAVETIYKLTSISFAELVYCDKVGKLVVRFNEPNPRDRISTLRTAYILVSPDGKALVNKNNEILTQNIK